MENSLHQQVAVITIGAALKMIIFGRESMASIIPVL
jgi:hypothetical protein